MASQKSLHSLTILQRARKIHSGHRLLFKSYNKDDLCLIGSEALKKTSELFASPERVEKNVGF